MKRKILIMGLPGSGKTTLAEILVKKLNAACPEFGNKIKIVELPNIMDIFYGRGVGYNIEEIELSKEMQDISATKIRAGEIGQDGKVLGKRPE